MRFTIQQQGELYATEAERRSGPHVDATGMLVPSVYSGEPAQFNGFYVADFDKVAKIIGSGAPVFHYNGLDPAGVSFSFPDIIGILTPMRKNEGPFERPDWMDRLKGTAAEMPPHDPETGEIIEDEPAPKFENLDRVAAEVGG